MCVHLIILTTIIVCPQGGRILLMEIEEQSEIFVEEHRDLAFSYVELRSYYLLN
jgi:hypothetical protein